MREREGELVGNEDLLAPGGLGRAWELLEQCGTLYGWRLAPSRVCGRMRCLGSALAGFKAGSSLFLPSLKAAGEPGVRGDFWLDFSNDVVQGFFFSVC